MQLRIIKPGLFSTLQDLGRMHHLADAVPVSGAMDTLAARIANQALGNHENAAIIEFTYSGAELLAETDLLIAYAGEGAFLKTDKQQLPDGRPIFLPAGTLLKLYDNPAGSRTCLAIAGGWNVPEVLGSRSTYVTAGFGGLQGRILQQGDVLSGFTDLTPLSQKIFNSLKGTGIKYPGWLISRQNLLPHENQCIRVIPAHEFTWFNGLSIVEFLSSPFKLSLKSNRMGYQLEGPAINRLKHSELLSTAVVPGTIQVTGNGTLILLMADCQTTGGYPRIAQVAAVDMPLCAQLKPGDAVYFKEISLDEAEMLYIELEKQLRKTIAAIENKYL